MSDLDRTLVVGTRGSPLALWQAERVIALLRERFPQMQITTRIVHTHGDLHQDMPLARMGGQGVFIKEIESALLAGEIDLAVHSLKDLPGEMPAGLMLAAIPERADPHDVLVSRHPSLAALPRGARVGTSSPRRAAQLRAVRPDLDIVPLRGNLGTRLRRAVEGDLDGAVLAAAGIIRLGEEARITEYLPFDVMLPAVGQGALAVQVRQADGLVRQMVQAIDHGPSHLAVRAERAYMAALGGGCQVPMAAYAELLGDAIRLQGMVEDADSGRILRDEMRGPSTEPEALGRALAERLLAMGRSVSVGKVYLVGGGPGEPGLLTVRGQELLRRAQVVVYDRLVDERLLAQVPAQAERVYVGKAADRHTLRQEEINALLVAKGHEGKMVVRLKGGDPYVFGRGGEEALALREAGVPFEVVPGVTSAVAVPAYAGIPVTHRRVAASFTVITGHEDPTKSGSQVDWGHLPDGTLVFLMGTENLSQIARSLVAHGRPAGTPAAFIHRGTTPFQRTIVGSLEDIAERVAGSRLGPPGILVVGEVVCLQERLAWFEERPLFGRRVLVTRSREQASAFSALLREEGAEPLELPAIEIRTMDDYTALDAAVRSLDDYDWVAFTSANGVRFFWDRLRAAGKDARALPLVCAIGPATAAALAERGVVADLQPEEYVAEALAKALSERGIAGRRFLLPRAAEAREVLPRELELAGASVTEVAAYRTVVPEDSRARLAALLLEGVDAIAFTSSSTVRNLVHLLDGEVRRLAGIAIAAIGPITADTVQGLGLPVDVVAAEYTIPGLVTALKEYFASQRATLGDVNHDV
ncbi:MAG: hydroxymethylbilane synthase [Bacteroidetes bacterium]|nr:hydroxymethylbilane synthase [Bacteroidota bacterium]